MNKLVLVIMLLCSTSLLGQETAAKQEASGQEFERINALLDKHLNNADSAYFYLEQLRTHTDKHLPNCQECYLIMEGRESMILYFDDQLEEAIESGEKACELAYEFDLPKYCVQSLTYIGYAYKQLGEIEEAANTFSRSMEIAREIGHDLGMLTSLRNIADLYLTQGELDKAITNAQRIVDFVRDWEDDFNWVYEKEALILLSTAYRMKKESTYLDSALLLSRKLLAPRLAARFHVVDSTKVLGNLGSIFAAQAQFDSAQHYLTTAYAIRQRSQMSQRYLYLSLVELVEFYQTFDKHDQALRYSNEIMQDVETLKDLEGRMRAYKRHAALLAELGRYEEAYGFQQQSLVYRDSLSQSENLKAIEELEVQYKTAAKEKEIELLTKNRALARSQRNLLLLGIIGLSVLGVLGFWFWSRRKASEREQLEFQAKQLKELDQLKTAFFTNVTHELRTPLTLIISPLQALLNHQYGQLDEAKTRVVQLVKRNGDRLQRLVDEILDMAKLEADKMVLDEEPVPFKNTIHRLFAAFESMASMRGIDYQLRYLAAEDLVVLLDVKKLEIIINNLLSNALKFTPRGAQILLRIEEAAGQLHLTVEDTGRGIAPDDLPHVFNRFYQTANPQAAQEGGTGIGLALAQEYVHLMGGTIVVDSKQGAYTIFTVLLPKKVTNERLIITKVKPVDTVTALPKVQAIQSLATAKPKLLIVEDHLDMRQFIASILSNEYHVQTAVNGKEALRLLTDEALPDLIISDVMMPEMDGFQLLSTLKTNEVFAAIPVVMLTARVAEADKLKALRIGVDDYLTKPFSQEELAVRITNLLQNASGRMVAENGTTTVVRREDNLLSGIAASDQEWLARVEEIALRELTNKHYNLSSLAADLHVSQSKLARQIKSITGLTPNKYLLELRLHKAKAHLEHQDLQTVAEVSYAIGFEDPNYFSKVYEQRFGKRPAAYFK